MANATTTLAGDIQLAGDLTGDAASPQLASTGITAGFYAAANLTVDSKGRVTAISAGLPLATTTTKGVVQIGSGLSVSGGVVSFTSTPATSGAKGVVQIGSNINVSGGVISIADATTSVKGVVQIGSGLSVSSGVVSFTGADATTTSKGIVQVGSGLSVTGGVLSANLAGIIPDATTSVKGVVRIGSGVTVASGVISIADATNSTKGIVTTADTNNITIASGVMSLGSNIPRLNTSNTYTAAQTVAASALTSSSSITANLSLSNVFTLTLAHNATLTPIAINVGKFTFIIKQNATGGFFLTFSSAFKFPTGHDTAIQYGANTVTIVDCVSNGTNLYCTLRKTFA